MTQAFILHLTSNEIFFFSISVNFSHFIMIRISQNKNMYMHTHDIIIMISCFFFKSSSSLDLGIEEPDYREENIISSQNSRRILCSLSFSIFLADASDFIFLEH